MIFTARQLQVKCQEQNVDLFITFVDLTKAFDTVSRDGLWKIMAKFGCPSRFIAMVRQFHDGIQARVQNDGEFSVPLEVTNHYENMPMQYTENFPWKNFEIFLFLPKTYIVGTR